MKLNQHNLDDILALIHRESRYDNHYTVQSVARPTGLESPTSIKCHDDLFTASNVAGKMREKICQWMYRVVDFCNYDRKITFTA